MRIWPGGIAFCSPCQQITCRKGSQTGQKLLQDMLGDTQQGLQCLKVLILQDPKPDAMNMTLMLQSACLSVQGRRAVQFASLECCILGFPSALHSIPSKIAPPIINFHDCSIDQLIPKCFLQSQWGCMCQMALPCCHPAQSCWRFQFQWQAAARFSLSCSTPSIMIALPIVNFHDCSIQQLIQECGLQSRWGCMYRVALPCCHQAQSCWQSQRQWQAAARLSWPRPLDLAVVFPQRSSTAPARLVSPISVWRAVLKPLLPWPGEQPAVQRCAAYLTGPQLMIRGTDARC